MPLFKSCQKFGGGLSQIMIIKKTVAYASLLSLAIFLLYFVYNNRVPEMERIERKVNHALPLGSSKKNVVSWLDKQGWQYTWRKNERSRSYRDVIDVRIEGVGSQLLVDGTGHIELVFSKTDKLEMRVFGQTLNGV